VQCRASPARRSNRRGEHREESAPGAAASEAPQPARPRDVATRANARSFVPLDSDKRTGDMERGLRVRATTGYAVSKRAVMSPSSFAQVAPSDLSHRPDSQDLLPVPSLPLLRIADRCHEAQHLESHDGDAEAGRDRRRQEAVSSSQPRRFFYVYFWNICLGRSCIEAPLQCAFRYPLFDKRMASEVSGDSLGDEFKGG